MNVMKIVNYGEKLPKNLILALGYFDAVHVGHKAVLNKTVAIAKSKNLKAAYLVCKDEHLAAIVQNPNITEEEIKNLPNANNILLKDFAYGLFTGYQKILEENQNQEKLSENKDEESQIPF